LWELMQKTHKIDHTSMKGPDQDSEPSHDGEREKSTANRRHQKAHPVSLLFSQAGCMVILISVMNPAFSDTSSFTSFWMPPQFYFSILLIFGNLHTVSSAILGAVERGISSSKQLFQRISRGKFCHADAYSPSRCWLAFGHWYC
jgi:hypothetical protein